MNCDQVRDLLPVYHYGELEGDELRAVEEHRVSCDACREELASVTATLDAVIPVGVPEMSEQFWTDNAAQIMRRIQRAPVRWFGASLWFAAAAAVALFIAASYLDTDDPVSVPAPSSVSESMLAEIAMSIEIENVSEQMESFWSVEDEMLGGFDAEFGDALGTIERSIDVMMLELMIVES